MQTKTSISNSHVLLAHLNLAALWKSGKIQSDQSDFDHNDIYVSNEVVTKSGYFETQNIKARPFPLDLGFEKNCSATEPRLRPRLTLMFLTILKEKGTIPGPEVSNVLPATSQFSQLDVFMLEGTKYKWIKSKGTVYVGFACFIVPFDLVHLCIVPVSKNTSNWRLSNKCAQRNFKFWGKSFL